MQSGKVNLTIVLPANDKTTSSTVGLLLGWDCDAEAADCARGTPTGYTFESGVARLVGVQVPNPRTWQPERNPTVGAASAASQSDRPPHAAVTPSR